ncbi:MAG: EutN/CcmL family microcompartment protein [Propionibacteriaceae bacterium]|jgi:ethanolamine utilization protein EutN|nr:EutN/CcmL family microcompartment protein [Propionibacteriaceae bacterium]
MYLAKVRGTVVSTSKDARLVGCKLLVTQQLGIDGEFVAQPEVSIDTVGAGVGETVIITKGSSARYAANRSDGPVDATIVGIVDQVEIEG